MLRKYLSTRCRKVSAALLSVVTMQSVCALKREDKAGKIKVTLNVNFQDFKDDYGKTRVPSITMYVVNCCLYIINEFNSASHSAIFMMERSSFWNAQYFMRNRPTIYRNSWNTA